MDALSEMLAGVAEDFCLPVEASEEILHIFIEGITAGKGKNIIFSEVKAFALEYHRVHSEIIHLKDELT
jgi:hypothetical protein